MSDTEDKYEHLPTGDEAANARTTEGPHFGKQARHEREKTSRFERVHMYAEFASFLVIIASGPIAIFELHDHTTELHEHTVELRDEAKKESLELAQTVYLTVDQRVAKFMKLCLENPRLDCYSVPQQSPLKHPLTNTERLQQRILYSDLTDVFEVAFVPTTGKTFPRKPKSCLKANGVVGMLTFRNL